MEKQHNLTHGQRFAIVKGARKKVKKHFQKLKGNSIKEKALSMSRRTYTNFVRIWVHYEGKTQAFDLSYINKKISEVRA